MAVLLLVSAPGAAQEQPQLTTTDGWYKYGVPFPDLDGPVPRMPDGKPDLSGQWATQRRADITGDRIPGYVPELPSISSQATFTQTFRRVNFGTIEHTFTVDDPKTYTEPFTIHNTWPLEPLTIKMLEYSCMEGNLENLVTGSITPWTPPEGDDAP